MKKQTRRSGIIIMSSLIILLGSLAYVMLLAIINGSLGFLCAMGVTIFGAIGVAKAIGESIAMSYGLIIGLSITCGVLRGLLRYFEQYSNHYIAFKLLAVLRYKVFKALRRLCPAKLESKQKGSIIAMITSDIETLEVFYAHTISPICIAIIVSTIVILFVGFISSWYLALITIIGYISIGVCIPIISSKRLKECGVMYREQFSSFNAYFMDSLKGIKDIILNNAGYSRGKEINKRSALMLEQTKSIRSKSTKAFAITELIVSIFILLTIVTCILLLSFEKLSIGKMIISAVTIFGSFGPVIAISALPSNLTQTFASGDRVLNLLAEKPVVEKIENAVDFEYENLEVTNLSFCYNDTFKVLQDIKMNVKKGEIVGIIGKSGCGKSTLLKLLLRFWEKDLGEINYNGNDITCINTDNLLQNVTLVSQTTYLFDESIENNLLMANPNATAEDIENACKMASIHNFILTLPQGYKTKVGMLGDNLSAGEKQRIGLARAFLRGSELILLDEPTSNVDSINEGIILKALKEQKNKKGIILVSHRESTMAIADRIYHIDNGKMREVTYD